MLEMILPMLVFMPFGAGLAVYAAGGSGGRDNAGRDAAGNNATGKDAAGRDAIGKDTIGRDATGKDAAGRDAAGNNATGLRGAGVALSVIFAAAELFLVLLLAVEQWGALSGRPDPAVGSAALRCALPGICGFGLHFVLDGFRMIYGCIAAFMWLMAVLLSGQYFRGHVHVRRFYLFLFWTLGAVMGVFLSADLFTLFLFFEIMSFTSYAWVAQEETRPSLRAAETYLAVAVTGGLVMLMGVFLVYHVAAGYGMCGSGKPLYFETLRELWQGVNMTLVSDNAAGSLVQAAAQGAAGMTVGQGATISAAGMALGQGTVVNVAGMTVAQGSAVSTAAAVRMLRAAGLCLLFGFGAKAGAFPLHIWLPKAHPVAPAPASALLSGILTKTGIYGALILSCQMFLWDVDWGWLILTIGVVTMLGGAVLAVFSVDVKRTLACSSMSQIGFILVGMGMQGLLGEGNALAVHGTMLHMVNHSLIKLTLFLAAGVIYLNTHALDLNAIRGWGRRKPLLKVIFLTGALAIGGIPLFGGYVSKTLLHEAIVAGGGSGILTAIEWLFLFSGGLTIAYVTKLYVAIFLEKNADAALQKKYDGQKKYMNAASGIAVTVSALVLFTWGLVPGLTMDRVAELSQGFMGLAEHGEKVEYFRLANLGGAMVSVGIGALVYLFFVRGRLLKRQEKGKTVYVNAWPAWLDLEERLYRPLFLTILPTVFGVLCRVLDSLADTVVVLLRKTLYRDSPLPHERPEGNVVTEALGKTLNGLQGLGNRLWNRKKPKAVNYRHVLAMKNAEFKETNRIIGRSLSFGLFLFGIGLALTLIYLVWY